MEANKNPVPVNTNDTKESDVKVEEEPEVLQFTKMMYNAGRIPKEQVDAMEMFTKGEMDYGTMRSLCG
tara:strand:+ start:40 stop:243 length:204 start_codon:yes stop_codon:yes gene_type:complete